MKPSPGPWFVIKNEEDRINEAGHHRADFSIAQDPEAMPLVNDHEDYDPDDHLICGIWADDAQAEANAHLIAASPEMLENLRLAVDLLDQVIPQAAQLVLDIGKLNTFMCNARPILAKFEGDYDDPVSP